MSVFKIIDYSSSYAPWWTHYLRLLELISALTSVVGYGTFHHTRLLNFQISIDETEITFDYVPFGYFDTFIQEYNDDGILISLKILYDGIEIFKKELVDSYEDNTVIISITIIISSSLGAMIGIGILFYKKKRSSLDPISEVDKMLKKIR